MPQARRIFIIDDEPDFCFFLKHNLEGTGEFQAVYETDPVKGLKLLQKKPPDALILDISMPNLSGLKVLEKLKTNKRTQAVPVIMVTALDDDVSRLQANTHYVEYYVNKPVDFQDLQKKIHAVLKRNSASAPR